MALVDEIIDTQVREIAPPSAPNPVLLQAQKTNAAQPAPNTIPVPKEAPLAEGETKTEVVSERTKTKGTVPLDSPSAVSFESAIDAINQGLIKGEELRLRNEAVSRGIAQQADVAKEVISDAVEDKQIIQTAKDTADMKAQIAGREIFEAMGGVERLTNLARRKTLAVNRMLKEQADVRENVNLKFADSPIRWIINKFTLGGEVQEANVAEAEVAKFDKAISNITSLASAADRAIEDTKVTLTTAAINANTALLAKQALLDSVEWELKAQETNAANIEFNMRANSVLIDRKVESYKLGLQTQLLEEEKVERDLRRKALKDDEDFRSTYVAGVREGRRRIGIRVADPTDATAMEEERKQILVEQELGGENAAKLNNQFEIGIGKVSPTPFQSAEAVALSNAAKFDDGSNPGLTAISDSIATVKDADADALGGIELTKETAPALINKQVEADFEAYEAEIKSGDTSNPNQAAPLAILVSAESVRNLPLVTKVLAPLMVDDINDLPFDKVLDIGISSVKTKSNPEGQITFDDYVTGITRIYKQAVVHNNDSQNRYHPITNPKGLGIPLQKGFNAKVNIVRSGVIFDLPALFDRKKVVDLTDYTEVSRMALQKLSANDKADRYRSIYEEGKVNRAQDK